MVDHEMFHDIVIDAFPETTSTITRLIGNVEKPNLDSKKLYEMLDVAN